MNSKKPILIILLFFTGASTSIFSMDTIRKNLFPSENEGSKITPYEPIQQNMMHISIPYPTVEKLDRLHKEKRKAEKSQKNYSNIAIFNGKNLSECDNLSDCDDNVFHIHKNNNGKNKVLKKLKTEAISILANLKNKNNY